MEGGDNIIVQLAVLYSCPAPIGCDVSTTVGAFNADSRSKSELGTVGGSPPLMQRRVRVHTLCMTASDEHTVVFRNCDLHAVVSTLTKFALYKALRQPVTVADKKKGARQWVTETIVTMLFNYRQHCSQQSPKTQLILPDALKLLPLYSMALLKHPVLLPNSDKTVGKGGVISISRAAVRAMERSSDIARLLNLPIRGIINSLYPRLYSLHALDGFGEGDATDLEMNEEELMASYADTYNHTHLPYGGSMLQLTVGLNKDVICSKVLGGREVEWPALPKVIPITSEIFEGEGIYLLDEGMCLWIYIGRSVSRHDLEVLFGIKSQEIYPESVQFRYSKVATLMVNVINRLRSGRGPGMAGGKQIKIIWADNMEDMVGDRARFSLRLVEDSIHGVNSYVDFLCKLHSKIQNKDA